MKPEIHPNYSDVKATCSCGNVIETRSTLGEDLLIDVCSSCHPFYTGKQKTLDAGGRVERFRKRFGNRTAVNKGAADDAAESSETGDSAESAAEPEAANE